LHAEHPDLSMLKKTQPEEFDLVILGCDFCFTASDMFWGGYSIGIENGCGRKTRISVQGD